MAKSSTVFDEWWNSWLEENHYYEAKEINLIRMEELYKVAYAAWHAKANLA